MYVFLHYLCQIAMLNQIFLIVGFEASSQSGIERFVYKGGC